MSPGAHFGVEPVCAFELLDAEQGRVNSAARDFGGWNRLPKKREWGET
jgi:pyrimidine deaminase RibD-like protein